MSSRHSIRRIIAIGLLTNLVTFFLGVEKLKSAERVEFHFEDLTIPLSIQELSDWSRDIDSRRLPVASGPEKNSDLAVWLNMLGFESRSAVSKFLQAPLVKDKSMARQLLKSWLGRRLLDEVSDVIRLDEDSTGTKVFNTLESLLEEQEEVSTLDLLKTLPADVIHIDLNEWVKVASSWRDELRDQQKLLTDLRKFPLPQTSQPESLKNVFDKTKSNGVLKESINEFVQLTVPHRSEPLQIEVWKPLKRNQPRKSWIMLMPGLGGDQSHFRWLARSLSHQGWPVVVLDHPGSDSDALNSLVEGTLPAPSGVEVFSYRLADLRSVLEARMDRKIVVPGEKLVLMGHSLGALTALFASGALPQEGLADRCKKALNDFSITNLSRLLQCQLVDVPLPKYPEIDQLHAVVGINSFGSLLWPQRNSLEIDVPVLLAGGTFDLITPALTEQLGLVLSMKPNLFTRVLVIEGASHFSPIRVKDQKDDSKSEDVFQLGEGLVGSYPLSVQGLLSSKITTFLESVEVEEPIPVSTNSNAVNLKYHLLDQAITKEILLINNLPVGQ